MGSLRLWHLVVRLRLDGVNEVDELDRILDEEDRHVVSDYYVSPCAQGGQSSQFATRIEGDREFEQARSLTDIPVALLGVYPRREASRITHTVGGTPRSVDGRKSDIGWGGFAGFSEDLVISYADLDWIWSRSVMTMLMPMAMGWGSIRVAMLTLAVVNPVKGVCNLNSPKAPAPRACTALSGIRSWSKCEIFSLLWKSCHKPTSCASRHSERGGHKLTLKDSRSSGTSMEGPIGHGLGSDNTQS